MSIEELQRQYKLANKEHDAIYSQIKEEITDGSLNNRECNIIIGQKASGKTTFSKMLADQGFTVYNKRNLDRMHPEFETLVNLYPLEYPDIIAPDVVKWNYQLMQDMMQKGVGFNHETTGSNIGRLVELISDLKEYGYKINMFFISINYLESRLRIYEDFIRNIERNRNTRSFNVATLRGFGNIPDIAEALDFDSFDSVAFLDRDLLVCDEIKEKDLFIDELRNYYNDVSLINFDKRIEFIINFMARYPDLIDTGKYASILEELNNLQCYYDALSGNNGMSLAKKM